MCAVVLMESFDKYPNTSGGIGGPAGVVNGWTCDENNGGVTTSGPPRTGARCITTAAGDAVHKVLPDQYTELIYGSGVICGSLAATNLMSFREVASGVAHVYLAIDGSGHLIAKHAGGTVYGTAVDPFVAATWYWVELRLLIDDTVGELEVRIGGDPVIGPLTGLDTRNGGSGYIDRLHYVASGITAGFDDIVVIDPTVGTPNDFIGDSRVECIVPNGNGASSVWVGSDADSVDNYLLVDEVPHDSDTTYVQSANVGDKDTYAFPSVSLSSGTIHAVQTTAVAKKSSAGSRKYVHVNRLSGGTEEDSDEFSLADSYVYHGNLAHEKPGGGAWTIADVNGAEFGVKVSA